MEIGFQFLQDFVRQVNVLPGVQPFVGTPVSLSIESLSGNFSGQSVSKTTLTRDHDLESSIFFGTKSVHFPDAGGQIGKMLQDMNGKDAIKKTIFEF